MCGLACVALCGRQHPTAICSWSAAVKPGQIVVPPHLPRKCSGALIHSSSCTHSHSRSHSLTCSTLHTLSLPLTHTVKHSLAHTHALDHCQKRPTIESKVTYYSKRDLL